MPNRPDVIADLDRARDAGIDAACLAAERELELPEGLLLAVASRETNCRNITGDGGHGRGVFQIDDRFHRDWLAENGAGGAGAVPPVEAAARYAGRLLAGNLEFGRRNGVREGDLLKFALSAYNAGAGGALAGYRKGDSDRGTTGRDYGRDVLERLSAARGWLGTSVTPERPELTQGARSAVVVELKGLLETWFAAHPPRPPFDEGPGYGVKAVAAVRAFQGAVGLAEDGVAGAQTWCALSVLTAKPEDRPVLRPGARGPEVALLKRLVAAWFAGRPPKPRFSPGPLYGPAAVEAVRAVQRANALDDDGVVGRDTWSVLPETVQPVIAPKPPDAR
jgi:hypothetical protein